MKRRFLIRGSCLVLAIGMILAGTGCEKRKRVPEDMTLGDEYLEKIVLASDVEERDFEEDGIRYHEFKTKKMIVTYPLIEKKVKSETEIRQESFSLRTDKSFFIGDRSFDYKKRTCWYKYVALPYVDRDDKMVKKEYSLYNAKGYIKHQMLCYKSIFVFFNPFFVNRLGRKIPKRICQPLLFCCFIRNKKRTVDLCQL